MAITAVHYRLLKEHAPLFKRGGALLEIGEANWYGDMDPREALDLGSSEEDHGERFNLFEIAKACYQVLFAPAVIEAVDLNGTPNAMRQDLNGVLKLPRKYDVAINHGTAEHVFSIAQVFYSMHHATLPGGYMIHDAPFTGWIDHGFYSLNPTLFYDLAAANDYDLVSLSITHIASQTILRVESREHLHSLKEVPNNAMLFVVLRKGGDSPFKIPMQGVYDGRLSEAGQRAWQDNR